MPTSLPRPLHRFSGLAAAAGGGPFRRSLMVGAFLLCSILSAWAHGDDQQVIDDLTEEIARAPEADLYIRRAEIYRHLEDWPNAEADYAMAARLAPRLALIDFYRARLLLEAGEAGRAWPLVEQFVAATPDEAEGWFLRGSIQAALGRPGAGANDYAEGLRRAASPRPEHFIRRAQLIARAAPQDHGASLAALDEGIAKIGPVISLLDQAIKFELEAQNRAGALERIALALQHSPRREAWLAKQGDVLVLDGRLAEAKVAYDSALEAMAALPERFRTRAPMEKLAHHIRQSLNSISGQPHFPP